MTATGKCAVRVDGAEFFGWKAVSIRRALDEAASSFQLLAAPASAIFGADRRFGLLAGAACEIYLDDEKVLTGYVDSVKPSYSATNHQINYAGRSKTADVIDCAAPPGQWKEQKIEQLAALLGAAYDVEIAPEVYTGDPLPLHVTQLGETVFEALERRARQLNLLITDDADGKLVFTRAGAFQAADALQTGVNIVAGGGSFDLAKRFARYEVYSQARGDDRTAGSLARRRYAFAEDSQVSRHRLSILIAETQADDARCQKRADWEALTRAGQSIQLEHAVKGWRQSDGALWRPNLLVRLEDTLLGVSGEYLITAVEYSLDENGTRTVISSAPAAAYEQTPLAKLGKVKKTTLTMPDWTKAPPE